MTDQTPLNGAARQGIILHVPWPILHRRLFPTLLSLFCVLLAPGSMGADTTALVEANTAFGLDLYAQLKSRPGNLFFSPYSISTALAITCAGAKGQTEKRMADLLHLPQDQAAVPRGFAELQRQLAEAEKYKGIQLNIANALWAQQGHTFLPHFLDIARNDFLANVNQVEFMTRAEAARLDINQWVAQKTQNRIQDLLPPRSLDAFTRLVLANAIYFKGLWTIPFEKAATATQPFHLTRASRAYVPLMHHLADVKYSENADFQAAELPYCGNQLSMVILLPCQIDGCGHLESQLTPVWLWNSLARMKRQTVDLFIPRFKATSSFALRPPLAQLGMPDAFGPQADFSGMDGTRLLSISDVFHKAWVEVNEEGSEAPAATAIVSEKSEAPPASRLVFRADHPFIYLIRDTRSGSVLSLADWLIRVNS